MPDQVPHRVARTGRPGRDPLAQAEPLRARQVIVHLLAADTQLPAGTGPCAFATAVENQRTLGIEVWEQAGPDESEDPAGNRKVGEGLLRSLPARLPAGTPLELTLVSLITGEDLGAVGQDAWLVTGHGAGYEQASKWGHWLRRREVPKGYRVTIP